MHKGAPRKKNKLTGIGWGVLLVAVIAFVWCASQDRLGNWSVPIEYTLDQHGGDTLSAMATIKAAQEGDFIPFTSKSVSRLGAPYIANWNDFPMYEEFLVFGAGMLAKIFGVMAAANLTLMLAHITAGLAFYLCCRFLRFKPVWSATGGILFAFAYYTTYRSLGHLFLAFDYTVPLAILAACLVCASRRLHWKSKTGWFVLALGFWLGLGNPYNLNMYAQMLCLGIVVNWFIRGKKGNYKIGLASLGLGFFAFVATNMDTFAYQAASGKNADALSRAYYETELFALKPLELIVPPVSHHIAGMAQIGSTYFRDAWVKGEIFSPYLGVVAIAGMLWMFTDFVFRLTRKSRKPLARPAAYAPLTTWVMIYSVIGGANCLLGLAGYPLFRGSNRFSIFISALVLMFMVSQASRWSRKWTLGKQLVIAVPLLLIGLYDQLPQGTEPGDTRAIASQIQTDKAFAENMESKLPAKAMVFQLPVVVFPESTAVNQLQAYEQYRPYFFTKTLHFSFGSNKGRPREEWQKKIEALPGEQMAAALEKFGFSAIYLNRKGFTDQAQGLLKELAAAGKRQVIEDDQREQVCVLLNPAAAPELPPGGSSVSTVRGPGWSVWQGTPQGLQAAGNTEGTFLLYPPKDWTTLNLTCQVVGLGQHRVTLYFNGKDVWTADLGVNQAAPVNLRLDAQPGKNVLRFVTDSQERPGKFDPMPRAFAVINPKVTRDVAK